MIYEIKPHPKIRKTASGDVRFRSLLEARWSLVFDMLHLDWEYEPNTFTLPSGRLYTPDFRVGDTWLEIKPTTRALRAVEAKIHEFVNSGLPLGARFFSFPAESPVFPNTGFRGLPFRGVENVVPKREELVREFKRLLPKYETP